ncbi:hypothetical protein SH668x_000506 [Planctomicrobium sp. SH668]|uniref:hypothetical protein n=1 Tax=Planctomicrobium sp. SH668 TaxID=3448126 RepID=UPI003F5C127B
MSATETIETEEQLVARAQSALSSCNWEIGECASKWTERHAKGRTDADFGAQIGLSGDQVYQRRRVWETFADVYQNYPTLKWSHFYVVINWDDAAECLSWASEMQATIAEMKAWRRAQHGEDLSTASEEEEEVFASSDYLSAAVGIVQDPSQFSGELRRTYDEDAPFDQSEDLTETAISAARGTQVAEYAPFAKGAQGGSDHGEKGERPELTPEQILKKTCSMLEKAVTALTPEVLESFPELPSRVQQRLLDAIENLQARTAGLS